MLRGQKKARANAAHAVVKMNWVSITTGWLTLSRISAVISCDFSFFIYKTSEEATRQLYLLSAAVRSRWDNPFQTLPVRLGCCGSCRHSVLCSDTASDKALGWILCLPCRTKSESGQGRSGPTWASLSGNDPNVLLYNEAVIAEAIGTMGSRGLGAWQISGVLAFKPTGFVI